MDRGRHGLRPRILVAQPSATLQRLIRMTLAAGEMAVECVADGQSALHAARTRPPDAVVADAALPGLDGYSLAEALRAEVATAAVPVLLVVPDYERPDVDRMVHAGIQDVLTRPFEQHDLLERVRGLLGGAPEPPAREVAAGPPVDEAALEARLAERLEARVAARVEALVEARLEALVAAAVERLAAERLAEAVARALPAAAEAAVERLGGEARAALQAAADRAVEVRLADEVAAAVAPQLEAVAWKVVPELAEGLILQEIRRLTEEGDA